SDMFILADGEPRYEFLDPPDHLMTVWHDVQRRNWTLQQYREIMGVQGKGGGAPAGEASQFHFRRHNDTINAGFVDTHVETFSMNPAGLGQIDIWKGGNAPLPSAAVQIGRASGRE